MRFKNSVRLIALFALITLALLAGGCDYGSKVWHDTQEAVNPNPTIDLHTGGIENADDNKLALLFTPVDEKILSLTSFLSNIDSHPDEDWFRLLFLRFPWISGVFTVNEEAMVLVKLPEQGVKPFNPGPLVEYEGEWSEIKMKSFVNYSEFGPEFYLCTPFFKDADFKGLVVVHFDPRVLLNFCPEPEKLVILEPDGGGVWTGVKDFNKEAFLKIDWDELLDADVHGITKVGQNRFVWLSRYISDTQLVYVTKTISKDDEDEDFWFF